jgi:phage host-nuclease inhibitor protein Gam
MSNPKKRFTYRENYFNMGNKVIEIELNDKQQSMFDEWCGHIKALRGEIGTLTWKVTPYGIGNGIKVYNEDLKLELDLTDTDSW